jgi:probable HAF family extracellular repeat protein
MHRRRHQKLWIVRSFVSLVLVCARGLGGLPEAVAEPLAAARPGSKPLPKRGYRYQDLSTLGTGDAVGWAINDHGQIAGHYGVPGLAFLYDGRQMIPLISPGDLISRAHDINNAGQVVGDISQRSGTSEIVGFFYDGFVMHDLRAPDAIYTWAYAINDNGQVVVNGSMGGNRARVFLYERGAFLDLSPWLGDPAGAMAINRAGHLAGGKAGQAFFFDGSRVRNLGTLGGAQSVGYGLNDYGEVVGQSAIGPDVNPIHAFYHNGVSMVDLGTLGRNSSAKAINNWGQIVGFSEAPPSGNHAFIWVDGVMTDLNRFIPAESDVLLVMATAINDAGQITGFAQTRGQYRPFLLTPIPDDTTPPTSRASVFPRSDAAGWHRGAVTITLIASDDPDGTGLRSITYAARGAQRIQSTAVNGTVATIRIRAEGETTFTYFATDNAGNAEAERTLTLRVRKGEVTSQTYRVRDLGTLGGANSRALDINNRGEIVGFAYPARGEYHAFLYRDGSMRDLGTLGGVASQAFALNDRGEIVGWAQRAPSVNSTHGFLYRDGAMVGLGTLGGLHSYAQNINEAGQIVGWASLPSGNQRAFLYQDGKMADLGTLGGRQSSAWAINDSGQIVGETQIDRSRIHPDTPYPDQVQHAFLYNEGRMTDLGIFGQPGEFYPPLSLARAINTQGVAVGNATVARTRDTIISHAVVFEGGRIHSLGTLGGDTSTAYGINRAGQIVGVSSYDRSTRPHAFLFEGGEMIDLNEMLPKGSGWELSGANAINDRGEIVGWGILHGVSDQRAFLLTPVLPGDTPPKTIASQQPLPNRSGWHTGDVLVGLHAEDNEAVEAITYSATGAQPIPLTQLNGGDATVPISTEGETTLIFSARDRRGTTETPQTLPVRIDRRAPQTTATTAIFAVGIGRPPGTQVTLRAVDGPGSGVEAITYSATGAQPIGLTTIDSGGSFSITAEGRTTVTFSSRDRAGNLETLQTLVVAVGRDRIPPNTTATLSPPPNTAGLNTSEVTVTLNAADEAGGTGVEAVTYLATGAQSIPRTRLIGDGTIQITITAIGTTTIRFFAQDSAGNVEPSKSVTLRIVPGSTPPASTGGLERLTITYEALSDLARQSAKKVSVADALCAKLETARTAKKAKTKAKAISGFVALAKKHRGKALTRDQADLLIRLVRAL